MNRVKPVVDDIVVWDNNNLVSLKVKIKDSDCPIEAARTTVFANCNAVMSTNSK